MFFFKEVLQKLCISYNSIYHLQNSCFHTHCVIISECYQRKKREAEMSILFSHIVISSFCATQLLSMFHIPFEGFETSKTTTLKILSHFSSRDLTYYLLSPWGCRKITWEDSNQLILRISKLTVPVEICAPCIWLGISYWESQLWSNYKERHLRDNLLLQELA